jgi:hypothetical protein
MISPYSSGAYSNTSKINPYQLPSSTNTASAFDVGSTGSAAPVFQSSALGLSNPSSTTSALDTSPVSGGVDSGVQQILSMLAEMLTQLIQQVQANSGSGTNSPSLDQSGTPSGSDSGTGSATASPTPTSDTPAPSTQSTHHHHHHHHHGKAGSQGSDKSTTDPGSSTDSSATPSPSSDSGTSAAADQSSAPDQSSGNGWNKNVAVMASSAADKETVTSYSDNHAVGGYLGEVEKGMDSTNNIADANAYAQQNSSDGAVSSGVTANSLVKGKGGNAIVVTGDNYPGQDADDLAAKLKQDYGMNVTVIKDASPNQLKDAIQKMGQQNGQQCMVAVLGHGAPSDSGSGDIALGKGDGDQWLTEDALKSEVNQYLSPSYSNVNVMFNSCYSGNFVN